MISESMIPKIKLWIAQGFGSGCIPFGPGTFGSIVGLAWFALLLLPQSLVIFFAGILLSIPFSVWLCGEAEKIMGESDPGSVVLDEIIAIPLCFASWLAALHFNKGVWPDAEYFFLEKWPMVLVIFVLFRIFDIAKPWPVRQSQKLPGGWGVTMDDVLAAVYVNIVVGGIWLVKPALF